jgi:hypothetical protein
MEQAMLKEFPAELGHYLEVQKQATRIEDREFAKSSLATQQGLAAQN